MEEEIRVGEKVGEGDNAETLLADIMEVDGSVREKMVLKKRFKAMSLVDTIKRLQVQKQVEAIGDPRIITETCTGVVWVPGDQIIDLQLSLQTALRGVPSTRVDPRLTLVSVSGPEIYRV